MFSSILAKYAIYNLYFTLFLRTCGNIDGFILAVAAQSGMDSVPLQEPQPQNNQPSEGAEWVDLFVREMSSATSIDDARFRAARILESLEKSISSRAGVEVAQSFHKVRFHV